MAEKEKVKARKKEEKPQETPPGLLLRSVSCERTRPEEKGGYGFKSGVLAFVDWNGQLYVTTGTRIKMELLKEAGLDNLQPDIEVHYLDGSVKSKRRLKDHANEPESNHPPMLKLNRKPKETDIHNIAKLY